MKFSRIFTFPVIVVISVTEVTAKERPTATATTTPAYCTTDPPPGSFTILGGTSIPTVVVVPPIPCLGTYHTQAGLCCKNSDSGPGRCAEDDVEWRLPLAPCVTINPQYNGCPGNQLRGVCCDGAAVTLASNSSVVCGGSTVIIDSTSLAGPTTLDSVDITSTTSTSTDTTTPTDSSTITNTPSPSTPTSATTQSTSTNIATGGNEMKSSILTMGFFIALAAFL